MAEWLKYCISRAPTSYGSSGTCVYMCVQMVVADRMVVADCTINNVPLYLEKNRGDFDKPTSVVLISRSGGHVR